MSQISGISGASGTQNTMKVVMDMMQLMASVAQDAMNAAQGLAQSVMANQHAAAQQVDPSHSLNAPSNAGGSQGNDTLLQMLMMMMQLVMQMLQQGQDDGGAPTQPSHPPCSQGAQQVATQLPPPGGAGGASSVGGAGGTGGAGGAGAAGGGASTASADGASATQGPDAASGPTGTGMVGPAGGKYDADIEHYAQQYNLNPDLVKAQIAKESQGNPNSVSPAGAYGLGQIKPDTASELAGRPVSAEELKTNTKLNIELTCKYDAQLKKQCGGSDEAMLAAYNQGPYANNPLQNSAEAKDYVQAIMSAVKAGKLPSWGGG